MSGVEVYIDSIDGRTHAAVTRRGKLTDLYVDPLDRRAAWGATYMGKVIKIDTRLDAAIVDIGDGVSGILAGKHVHLPGRDFTAGRPDIGELLTPGQSIVVQIKAEANRASPHETRKLPRLTMKLYVIGQYLVYSPAAARFAARKIVDKDKNAALTAGLPGGKAWLAAPKAEKAARADIETEARGLDEEWQTIKAAAESGDKTPRLILDGPDAIRRMMNDYGALLLDHIHCGNRDIFNRLERWCQAFDPALAQSKRLRLFKPQSPADRLFEICDLYSELEYLQDNRIALSNGGSVIIDRTHALTVIDVNQGSAPSAAEANQEAAREISRQIWLRNLSGAILIDFISMHQKSERFQLIENLTALFTDDGAGVEVLGFTRLGIIEMTRKRRTASYHEKMLVLTSQNS